MIINCHQGSEEWFQARCGVITASMFSECRKTLKSGPNKGDFTTKAKEYAFKLACERMSGKLLDDDQFETYAMRRGRELEPDARLLHEQEKGLLVERAGFALSEDGLYGASVDGLIDDDGMSEYKCFVSPSSLMPILLNNDIADCMDQIQGGLWVTGRKWAHFCLYCPALEPVKKHLKIIEAEREDNYIEELQSDLEKFNNLVNTFENELRAA